MIALFFHHYRKCVLLSDGQDGVYTCLVHAVSSYIDWSFWRLCRAGHGFIQVTQFARTEKSTKSGLSVKPEELSLGTSGVSDAYMIRVTMQPQFENTIIVVILLYDLNKATNLDRYKWLAFCQLYNKIIIY